MMLTFGLIIAFVGATSAAANTKVSCKDPNNKDVDWWIAIKLPKLDGQGGSWTQATTGAGLLYQDSNKPGQWQQLQQQLDQPANPYSYSISKMYDDSYDSSIFWAMYSDQSPPNKDSASSSAHAKGLVMFSQGSGLWLVHSIPGFPQKPSAGAYQYPPSGYRYAQSMLCISLPFSALETVAGQLNIDNVFIYEQNLPTWVTQNQGPGLNGFLDAKRIPVAPYWKTVTLASAGGANFRVYAKDKAFGDDLYTQDVSLDLQTPLFVEGWRNGPGNLITQCDIPYPVYNVDQITVTQFGLTWSTNNDHSKWAISANAAKPWVCIGDINRQKGQFVRGGGTICQNNAAVWQSFRSIVGQVDACGTR